MGRPKAFAEEQVLRKAMQVFCDKGYEAASLNDLLQAMGISRSSLYDTFGDKAQLFHACLRQYKQTIIAERLEVLKRAKGVWEGLGAFLQMNFVCKEPYLQSQSPCLLQRAQELGPNSVDQCFAHTLEQSSAELKGALAELLLRGQKNREISSQLPVEDLVAFLFTISYGLAGLHQNSDIASTRTSVELVLRQLLKTDR